MDGLTKNQVTDQQMYLLNTSWPTKRWTEQRYIDWPKFGLTKDKLTNQQMDWPNTSLLVKMDWPTLVDWPTDWITNNKSTDQKMA